MKKCMFVFVLLGLLPVHYAGGYEYQDVDGQYTTTQNYKKVRTIRRSGGYNNTINNNFYYGQPVQQASASKRSQMYRDYDNEQPVVKKQYTEQTKTEYSSQMRKYFLAHPFFQPLKGKFGSVTDLSYSQSGFKFDILNAGILDLDNFTPSPTYGNVYPNQPLLYSLSGKAKINQLLIKEDVSFGLSDTLSLILTAQYDKTKVKIGDYSTNNPSPDDLSNNEVSHSGLNIFGIGLQNRFVDNDEWIAMFSGFFQHQKDTANTLLFDIKGGYKINKTTVYGLARLGYSNLIEDDIYGAFWDDASGDWLMLSYNSDAKDVFYIEGGAGLFSVLNKYTYLGGELIYGHYDWHNQLNIKGTIGFQPNDSFALSFYASASLYDSAKNKVRQYMQYDVNPDIQPGGLPEGGPVIISDQSKLVYTTGDYKIKSYNEWKIGLQAILYF